MSSCSDRITYIHLLVHSGSKRLSNLVMDQALCGTQKVSEITKKGALGFALLNYSVTQLGTVETFVTQTWLSTREPWHNAFTV